MFEVRFWSQVLLLFCFSLISETIAYVKKRDAEWKRRLILHRLYGSGPKLKSEIGHIILELMHYLWISKAIQGCCRLHFSSPAHFPFSFTGSLTMRYYGFLMVSVIGQRYITEAINKDNTILRDPQSFLVLLTYIPLITGLSSNITHFPSCLS